MKVGFCLGYFTWPGGSGAIAPVLAEVGRASEEAGVASLSVMDHYLQIELLGDAEDPMLEGYSTLGFLAGHTRTVRLHLLVTGVTYRHPGLLAKIVSTVDVLSGGRACLGIGAAWYEREHRALGVPFPPLAQRFERLEETLRIVRQMWSGNDGPFHGVHYQLAETLNSPQPIGRPPVIVGGLGERRTLRLVAEYADGWNLVVPADGSGPDLVRHKLNVLREHCARLGRDYDSITKSMVYGAPAPVDAAATDAFLAEMRTYAELGMDEVQLNPFRGDPRPVLTHIGNRIVPALADLSP